MEHVEAYRVQFDQYLSKFRTLNYIEAKTKVPKVYFTLGAYFIISVSVFFNIYASLTTNTLGLLYPTYRLLLAAQKADVDNLKAFGTYFAIFALLDTIEEALLEVLLYYFPFYFVGKLVFLFWLFLPGYQGASTIYALAAPRFAALFAEPKKQQ
ncbi:TB2/DP1, HVA22 family-domain-containing protein [Zopfochytrium polystomum]|nr:TB2/DP1, HVA22 family-domain-containing protein [Zopfochytrium polystomum]